MRRFLIICASFSYIQGLTMFIDTFKGECSDYDVDPRFTVSDISFFVINNTTYMSHKVENAEDIPDEIKMEIFPIRCESKEASNTCETLRPYKLKNVCRFIMAENVPWTPFIESYNPPMTCPIKKGTYFLNNGILNPLELPSWTKSYWKLRIVVRRQTKDEFIFCATLDFQLL